MPAPVYGNYKGYYTKRRQGAHAHSRDERLALIPASYFTNKRILDIGCNSGAITVEIAQHLSPAHITGVDIDTELVSLAHNHLRLAWSRQRPPPHSSLEYPISMPRIFGYLPMPSPNSTSISSTSFPCNVSFKTANWIHVNIPQDDDLYDIILAFSVTKWIHLNFKDQGIHDLFSKAFACLAPHGKFIVEPQEWSSYAHSKRHSDTLRANYETLALRPSDFHNVAQEVGFVDHERLGVTGEGGFRRCIDVYSKP